MPTKTIGKYRCWYQHRIAICDQPSWVVSQIMPPEQLQPDPIISWHKNEADAIAAAKHLVKQEKLK